MLKKASAIILALCMITALSFTVGAEDEALTIRPWEFCGALLDAEAAGLVVGTAYSLVYEIEADATTGYRVRYSSGDGEAAGPFAHNDENGDPMAHSSDAATAAGLVANQIPARFTDGTIAAGTTATITVNFVFGADLPDVSPSHMKFIGLFGMFGGADFNTLGAALKDASGNTLIGVGTLEGSAAPAPTPAPAGDGGGDTPAPVPSAGGAEQDKHETDTGLAPIATVAAIAVVATVGVVVSVKKKK
ncbi:MAG: hypothetical protein FWG70_00120 [Oscillospiraceae bacterium]|nr:hypothetical protein [Oscillospiraceae bacterium]